MVRRYFNGQGADVTGYVAELEVKVAELDAKVKELQKIVSLASKRKVAST